MQHELRHDLAVSRPKKALPVAFCLTGLGSTRERCALRSSKSPLESWIELVVPILASILWFHAKSASIWQRERASAGLRRLVLRL